MYALDNPPDILNRLDVCEGCGPNHSTPHNFERVERDVVLESGVEENAWVYLYSGSTANKQVISSGDFRRSFQIEGRESDLTANVADTNATDRLGGRFGGVESFIAYVPLLTCCRRRAQGDD